MRSNLQHQRLSVLAAPLLGVSLTSSQVAAAESEQKDGASKGAKSDSSHQVTFPHYFELLRDLLLQSLSNYGLGAVYSRVQHLIHLSTQYRTTKNPNVITALLSTIKAFSLDEAHSVSRVLHE